MQLGTYKFDRLEFAGSLGDLGTLIPLSAALILIAGLNVTSVFLVVGLFYIASGVYFRLPIPVQPLKVVAAIAIAYPEKITSPIIMASALLMGIFLLLIAFTGFIDWLAKSFSKPIIRGIQFGLGLILINKGIALIVNHNLFVNSPSDFFVIGGVPVNLIIGILATFIVLLLIRNEQFPAALVIITMGIIAGIAYGALSNTTMIFGAVPVEIIFPTTSDFVSALILLVIPQIPLTIGNAIIGTKDACESLFGKNNLTQNATHKALAFSMGIVNVFAGLVGGIPMCHGAGGLAAHYRFGARTGGSNIMIGLVFLIIALVFGKIGIAILLTIPNAILGTLLLFAGLELAMLILDVRGKNGFFIVLIVAGIGFATTNISIGFLTGIIIAYLFKWKGSGI